MAARVITIAQQKGGAGKTTLAAHLALAWLALGQRVALVDIDPQGSLSQWFALRQAAFGAAGAGLTLSSVTGWRASGEIERLSRDATLIVIDSPPHAQTEARMAIRAAHLVVVPVQPSPLDLWATKPTLDITIAEKIPALLVLNRVPARSPLKVDALRILGEMGVPVAAARLGNRGGLALSMAEGKGIAETAPDTIAAREVAKLGREILSRVGGRG